MNNTIEIDGIKYTRQTQSDSIKIVVLHRGFIYVGRFEQDGPNCTLKNAYNVRKWGTSKGLGELALDGPLEDTVLDKCGVVEFHELGIICKIKCSEVWKNVI